MPIAETFGEIILNTLLNKIRGKNHANAETCLARLWATMFASSPMCTDGYNDVVNNRRWSPQEEGVGCSEQQVFPSVKNQGYRTSRT